MLDKHFRISCLLPSQTYLICFCFMHVYTEKLKLQSMFLLIDKLLFLILLAFSRILIKVIFKNLLCYLLDSEVHLTAGAGSVDWYICQNPLHYRTKQPGLWWSSHWGFWPRRLDCFIYHLVAKCTVLLPDYPFNLYRIILFSV